MKTSSHLFHVDMPALSEYVGSMRLLIGGISGRMGFSLEEVEDIKIAFSEACNNAVQYAYPAFTGAEKVEIKIKIEGFQLEIQVKDFGRGFDVSSPPKEHAVDDPNPHLGLGLHFMQSMMDEMKVESTLGKGTQVRLMKKVKNPSLPQTEA